MIDIYYLDDETALCQIFQQSFSSQEIKITTFTNATEAIAACESIPPKAIFIDFRLQDTTGDIVAESLDDRIIKFLVTGDLVNPNGYQFEEVFSKPFEMTRIQSLLDDLADE